MARCSPHRFYVADDHVEQTIGRIESVTQIEIAEGAITGKKRCSIVERDIGAACDAIDSSLVAYGSLDYSLMLIAPPRSARPSRRMR